MLKTFHVLAHLSASRTVCHLLKNLKGFWYPTCLKSRSDFGIPQSRSDCQESRSDCQESQSDFGTHIREANGVSMLINLWFVACRKSFAFASISYKEMSIPHAQNCMAILASHNRETIVRNREAIVRKCFAFAMIFYFRFLLSQTNSNVYILHPHIIYIWYPHQNKNIFILQLLKVIWVLRVLNYY